MIKGTTAQFKFKLPCTKEKLLWVTMTVGQTGNPGPEGAPLPIIKRLADCPDPMDSTELHISLTPLETMRFSEKRKAYVQFRGQRSDGSVFGNKTKYVPVYPMSDDILDSDDPILPGSNGDDWIIFDGQPILG